MNSFLTVNTTTKAATTPSGDAWAPPLIVWGESLTLKIRTVAPAGDQVLDDDLDIRATKAAVGFIDAPSQSGSVRLQLGEGVQTEENTTAVLSYNCANKDLQDAINALDDVVTAYGAVAVQEVDGSFVLTFGDRGEQVPMQLRNNELRPMTLAQQSATAEEDGWVHELRLVQAPIAFTDVAERVLPDPPSIAGINDGGGSGDGLVVYPEKQALKIPPNFRGTFYLQDGADDTKRTVALSRDDDPATIQAALETVYGTGNITCTLADSFLVHIEFTGDLLGIDQELLEVVPADDQPPGDLNLTLNFDGASLLRRLRAQPVVIVPLEVRVYLGEAMAPLVLLLQTISIGRPLIWPDLALVPELDFLRPASPVDYKPFSTTAVIQAHRSYGVAIGNGAATSFVIDHALASDKLLVAVRENTSGGRELINGTDYRVTYTSANSLTVTALLTTPGNDAWGVLIQSGLTVAQFAEGLTVTEAQVTGLVADLAEIRAGVSALAEQAATVPLGVTSSNTTAEPIVIQIDDAEALYPGFDLLNEDGSLNFAAAKEVPGGLLPAIHDSTVTSLTSLPVPSLGTVSGNVYQNNTGAGIVLPGGLGTPNSTVANGEYFGGDGRRNYPVSLVSGTTSAFPRDFERPLFEFEIFTEMLRAGTLLTLNFALLTQLLNANTKARYVLVLEHGAAASQTSPATTAPNLSTITWNTTPLLSVRLGLEANAVTRSFGCEVIRRNDGTLAANKVVDGFKNAAGSVPSTGDFLLRARLVNFDTVNAPANARGAVYWKLTTAKAEIAQF